MNAIKNILEGNEKQRQMDSLKVLTEKLLIAQRKENNTTKDSLIEDFSDDSVKLAKKVEEKGWDIFMVAGEGEEYITRGISKKVKSAGELNQEKFSTFEERYFWMYENDKSILSLKADNRIIENKILEKASVINTLVDKINKKTDFEYPSGTPEEFDSEEIDKIDSIIDNKISAIKQESSED